MAAKKKALSTAHKKALAKGREEARIISAYLEALKVEKPKRGRKRTIDSVKRQLAAVQRLLATGGANPVVELKLIQRKLDLEGEIKLLSTPKVDTSKLEAAFTEVAKSYGARLGISAAAWKAVGVPPAVIKRAGL